MKILLPIHPEYVDKIISGEKKYEYRRIIAHQRISEIIIYATSPEKKVVGTVKVCGVLQGSPENIWELTSNQSGMQEKLFYDYFDSKKIAYAYQLGAVNVFKHPRTLIDYNIKGVPQSFIYID